MCINWFALFSQDFYKDIPAIWMRTRPFRWPRTSCLRFELVVCQSLWNQSSSHRGWWVIKMALSFGPIHSSATRAKYLQSEQHTFRLQLDQIE